MNELFFCFAESFFFFRGNATRPNNQKKAFKRSDGSWWNALMAVVVCVGIFFPFPFLLRAACGSKVNYNCQPIHTHYMYAANNTTHRTQGTGGLLVVVK